MKTKIFTFSLALFASISLCAQTSGTCGPNLTWVINNGVLTISGSGPMYDWGDYRGAPWFSNRANFNHVVIGDSVTTIGKNAFCEGGFRIHYITSINIGNGVVSIGGDAIWSTSLRTIVIGQSFTTFMSGSVDRYWTTPNLDSISVNAGNTKYDSRNNCNALIETSTNTLICGCNRTIIPQTVDSIGRYAFGYISNMTTITLPEGLLCIGDHAFADCTSLVSLAIPNSVKSIGEYAFYRCSNLSSIQIGNGVSNVGSFVFASCDHLASPVYNDSVFIYLPQSYYGNYIIPAGLKRISSTAFYNCIGLTSISFPNSVTSIGDFAFALCTNLNDVHMSDSLQHIDDYAFSGCTGLTSITLPQGIKEISPRAFSGCNNITSIIWNAKNCTDFISYTQSPFYAIRSNITSFTIGDNVQRIPEYLCYEMSSISSVTISNNVTDIGYKAFYSCSGLMSITIPCRVDSIGRDAFNGCNGLSFVQWNAKNCSDCSSYSPFRNTNISSFVFGDSVQHIPDNLCNGLVNLTSITLPNSVVSIGYHAFNNCSGIQSVTIPDNVNSIWREAFSGCSSLRTVVWNAKNCADFSSNTWSPFYAIKSDITSFTIGDSVQHLPTYLCYGMKSLSSITLPRSVTSVGNDAFNGCSGLAEVHINDIESWCGVSFGNSSSNPLSYAQHLFVGEEDVKALDSLPSTIISIPNYAFYGATFLSYAMIPNTVTTIGTKAFYNLPLVLYNGPATGSPWGAKQVVAADGVCGSNVTWSLTDGLLSISGTGAMTDYASESDVPWYSSRSTITSVSLSNGVTTVGSNAFNGCTNLTSVSIQNDVNVIGEKAFYGCTGLVNYFVPKTISTIGEDAFYNVPRIYYKGSATGSPWGAQQVISADGFCGDNLYWDLTDSTLTIGGCGVMTDYASATKVPWYSSRALIKHLSLDEEITRIGDHAFHGCDQLFVITIPQNIDTIGQYAFSGCNSLKNVSCQSSTPPFLGPSAWNSSINMNDVFLIVPCSTDTTYAHSSWGNYFVNIVDDFPYSVEVLSDNTEQGSVTLAEIGCEDRTARVVAQPNDGYGFERWSDGDTLAERTLVLTQDTVLTAYFVKQPFGMCGNSLSWRYKDGVLSISGKGAMYNYGILDTYHTIPPKSPWDDYRDSIRVIIIGDSVTALGQSAFYGCVNVDTFVLGSSADTIPYQAFNGCQVWNMIFNATHALDRIYDEGDDPFSEMFAVERGSSAFYRGAIHSLRFGEGTTHIPDYLCYKHEWLESVILPLSVTSIGSNAFGYCSHLSSINLPDNLDTIGKNAFTHCDSLKKIVIPESVKYIDESAFTGCSGVDTIVFNAINCNINVNSYGNCSPFDGLRNKAFIVGNKVTQIPWFLCYHMRNLREIIIPNSVKTIASRAFCNCDSLSIVELGDSVNYIGEWSFGYCSSLDSIIIPTSVSTIGNSAFFNCSGLMSIIIPNSVVNLGEECFRGCTNLTSAIVNASGILKNGTFSDCTNLTDLFIGDGITSIKNIGGYVKNISIGKSVSSIDCRFPSTIETVIWNARNCTDFTSESNSPFSPCQSKNVSISFGSEVRRIPAFLCSNMRYMTTLEIGENVTTIGQSAFEGCYSITSLTLPRYLVSIDDWAFMNMVGLTEITCLATTPPAVTAQVFSNYSIPLKVPCDSRTSYQNHNVWGRFTNISCDVNTYVIMFLNEDSTLLQIDTLAYGAMPEYRGEDPVKPNEGDYFYVFTGWEPEVVPVVGNAIYVATYESHGTGLDNVAEKPKPIKVMEDGKLYILLPNGTKYSATGRKVE